MPEAFYQQGFTQAADQDHEGAIAAFTQALQQQPDFADAYQGRGRAYFKSGNFPAAIADYTQALQINGDDVGGYFARGLAYLAVNNLEAAIADAKQALLRQPDYAAAYNLIGTARHRQGASPKAIASYKKAVELYLDQRDIANCRRCLGQIRQLQGMSQPAVVSEPAVASDISSASGLPSPPLHPLIDPNEFLKQALQKAQRRDYRGAMEDLDWAIQIDPEDAEAYAIRGQVRSDLGDFQGAIEDFQQAATLFVKQSHLVRAQQMQESLQTLQAAQQKAAKRSRFYSVSSNPRLIHSDIAVGKPSRKVQRQLLQLVGDDRKIAIGLVKRLKLKHPGKTEDWYWEKAIYDLNRDR